MKAGLRRESSVESWLHDRYTVRYIYAGRIGTGLSHALHLVRATGDDCIGIAKTVQLRSCSSSTPQRAVVEAVASEDERYIRPARLSQYPQKRDEVSGLVSMSMYDIHTESIGSKRVRLSQKWDKATVNKTDRRKLTLP